MFWEPYIEGVIIGASSGVTAAGLVGIFGWVRHEYRRGKQIEFLRKLLCEGHNQIFTQWEQIQQEVIAQRETDFQARTMKKLYENVESALQRRCRDMSYDQIKCIHNAFSIYRRATSVNTGRPPISAVHHRTFDALKKISFLRLHKCLPTD